MFYQRLFEIDPSTRPLFSGTDMKRQNGKLIDAIGLVVDYADHMTGLTNALEDLGRRHVRYGVEDRHYDSVGAALIWTLEQGLGCAFTEDVRAAWVAAYDHVSTTMRLAARDAVQSAA